MKKPEARSQKPETRPPFFFWLLASGFWLLSGPLIAQAPKDPGDRIVANINGETITVREFNQMWDSLSPELRDGYEKAGGKLTFLDTFIKRRLLIQESLKQGFDKRPDVALDLRMVRDSTLFDRYVREVVAEDVIQEAELLEYYNKNPHEFQRPEMIRVRHIIATPSHQGVLNSAGDNAKSEEEALQKMMRLAMMFRTVGGDFVDIARKFSEDNTAASGGDLGWFARGKMVPEFEDVAFRLAKPGDISAVTQTEFGYHIIKLEERRKGGLAPFSDVREEIRARFLRERQVQILEVVGRLTQELRAASKIAVYPENL